MPKCEIFKKGVCIGPTGAVRPCCAFRTEGIPNMRFDEDWQTRHDAWDKAQQQDWIPQCIECQQVEQSGKTSLRELYNQQFETDVGIKHWDLKINNTCNLACRMCDNTSSSKWAQLIQDHTGFDMHYTVQDNNRWHKQAVDFVDHMYDAKVVKFTGGEPFMIPQVKHVIEQLIDRDIAAAVKLELITNGSYDISAWNKYFEHFDSVWVNISVDAVGKRYEYIRPYSSWDTVSTNILSFQNNKPSNTEFGISTLPMILNKDHIHEVAQWCQQHGLNHHVSGEIITPDFLRVDAWQHDDLRTKFVQQMKIQDEIHGTDWREFVNE